MGSLIEFNDTLKLKRGNGFPDSIELDGEYAFTIKDIRLYHLDPIRVFLVEEIAGKWNFVGHAVVLEQHVDSKTKRTSGVFKVIKIYDEAHRLSMNQNEAPNGKGYTG